jgi:hypothetical protein
VDDWNKAWCQRPGDFLNSYIRDKRSQQELRELMERVVAVLNRHGREGWRAQTRSFSYASALKKAKAKK